MTLSEQMLLAAAMSDAEIRSRKNAPGELRDLLKKGAAALDAKAAQNEHTSPEVAALAGDILARSDIDTKDGHGPVPVVQYNKLLGMAKTLAASCLTQSEDHILIPRAQVIEVLDGTLSPEADRALRDAIATNQAKPIISRDPIPGHTADLARRMHGDPIPPNIEDTEGTDQ